MSDYKMEMAADECICSNMKTFADYTIDTKFPSYYDGMKPIHRRILLVLHKDIGSTLKKELTVGGKVVEMHPHGDASINQAISVMAQPFSHVAPLVFSNSNIGTYDGENPAAPRYVDVCESDIAKALFFTDINPAMFKMIPSESEDIMEPAYLIPRIPTALMIQGFAIAVGFQTKTYAFAIPDLCKLTKEYIKIRNEGVDWVAKTKKSLTKYMLPDFPTYCVLRNSDELLSEYRKGNFDATMKIDGQMSIAQDRIIFTTLPPGREFSTTTFNVGMTMAKNKNSWESQNFQQMEDFAGGGGKKGLMTGNFECIVRRGVNPFDVLGQLKKKLQFTARLVPERHYSDIDGNMTLETPLTLLDKWYGIRYSAVIGDLKQKLNDMVDQQRRLLALIIIRDHADDVFKIFKTSSDEQAAVPKLVERFKLSKYQATFVASLKFSQVTSKGRDDLLKELEQVKKDMEDLQKEFHRIPEIMIESIERFEKKFVDQPYVQEKQEFDLSRRCVIPKFIGAAIYKDDGYMLMESEEEMDTVLKNFTNPDLIEFKLFDNFGDIRAVGADEDIDGDVPKYIKASYIDRLSHEKNTGCICHKGGALIARGLIPRLENMKQIVPIGNKFIMISKSGAISIETVDEKMVRKNPSAGPTMKDVVYIAKEATDVIVIHGSASQPNNLMIERVDLSKGPGKLRKIVIGEWKILNVVPADTKRIYVNVPEVLRQRCALRHLVFNDLGSVIKVGDRLNCNIGRTTLKSDFDLAPIRKKSTIMIAKPVK